MATQEAANTIILRVKVPPGTLEGGTDEFALGDVPIQTHIGAVRVRLRSLIPSHPIPERQRLLYGGRVLADDTQTLADALNVKRDPAQREYVIHLVIRGEGFTSTAIHPQANISTPQPSQAATNTAIPPHAPHTSHHVHGHHFPGMGFPTLPPGLTLPEQARAAFGQAVAQGQQQRAAMGMHGIGSTPPAAQAPGPTQPIPSTPQPAQGALGAQPPPRAVSSQGFHVQGVGPDGQHFQIHQQTFAIPNIMPGMPGFPNMMPMPHIPNMQQPLHHSQVPHPQTLARFSMPLPQNRPGPSPLDAARDNIYSIRQTLRDMSAQSGLTEEQRAQIDTMLERSQAISSYVDPFQWGHGGHVSARFDPRLNPPPAQRSTSPSTSAPVNDRTNVSTLGPTNVITNTLSNGLTPGPTTVPTAVLQPATSLSIPELPADHVGCFLLLSPQGPEAVIVSPQYGNFTSVNTAPVQTSATSTEPSIPAPTPTSNTAPAAAEEIVNDANNGQLVPAPEVIPEAVQQQLRELQAAQAPDDNLFGAAQPLLGHVWLLIRVLVFAYFFLGSNFGWQRPLAMAVIGLGFWLMRLGLLVEGGALRRWWDDLIAIPGVARPNVPPAADAQPGGARQVMPTPAQLAERLIAERNQQRDQRMQQARNWFRPVERALALFLASLWPGIGEAHVAATEREERRRLEEEIEARRREEEERNRATEEAEKSSAEKSALHKEEVPDTGEVSSSNVTTMSENEGVPSSSAMGNISETKSD